MTNNPPLESTLMALRDVRANHLKMTQGELARMLSVSEEWLNRFEMGRVNPTKFMIFVLKVSHLTGISVEDMFGWTIEEWKKELQKATDGKN